MPSILNPYLSFRDNAREAIEFYHSVFGGELTVSTFGENHMSENPADNAKIMHAQLNGPNGFVLMAADTPPGMEFSTGSNISISLSGTDEAELRGYWDKLVVGGAPAMPLAKAPWGDTFGMLVDRFGTNWMVNITGSAQ